MQYIICTILGNANFIKMTAIDYSISFNVALYCNSFGSIHWLNALITPHTCKPIYT